MRRAIQQRPGKERLRRWMAAIALTAGVCSVAMIAVASAQSGSGPRGDTTPAPRPLQARLRSEIDAVRVAPASFCGDARHQGLRLACGGEALPPRARLRLEPGSIVEIDFAETVADVQFRFERVLPSGAIQRLTHDQPLPHRRGEFAMIMPSAMPAGLVLALRARYRGVVFVPGLTRNLGAVDAAQGEFLIRLTPVRHSRA